MTPEPDTVADVLDELNDATQEHLDDVLARFCCTAWPSLTAQNN
jgi:hypothetical protein